ncbi:MAG TPA: hypothetical protein VJY15_04185, partial [Candidatus Acidoferrum sp.]|nr:hypothetical protein [Candidatus Acidoferrum sp.]
ADAILSEFQKRGLLLTYVLECPLEAGVNPAAPEQLLEGQLAAVMARIRRSLKPKRLVLFSRELTGVAGKFTETDIGCPVFKGACGPFLLDGSPSESEMEEFRRTLPAGSLL